MKKVIKLIIGEPSLMLNKKVDELTNSFIENRDDFNYLNFDFEETSLDDIVNALESPAFTSNKKVVVCKNPYFFDDFKTKVNFEQNFEAIENYIKNPNPDSLFIIIANPYKIDKRAKYYTLFFNNSEVFDLSMSDKVKLKEYATFLFSKTKLEVTQEAIDELVNRCRDASQLEVEFKKLITLNESVNVALIKTMVARPLEDNIFELSNAILRKDKAKTMQIYYDLKLLKVEPINIIGLLASSFRLLLEVAILKKRKNVDIATYLNVNPYRVKIALENLKNYSTDDIKDILCELSLLDKQIKNGQSDRYIAIELFLASK